MQSELRSDFEILRRGAQAHFTIEGELFPILKPTRHLTETDGYWDYYKPANTNLSAEILIKGFNERQIRDFREQLKKL